MKKIVLIGMMLVLPILLMLGIFQIGKNIQAALDIHGTWNGAISMDEDNEAQCTAEERVSGLGVFSIQQSGQFIQLTFAEGTKQVLRGKLTGRDLVLKNQSVEVTAEIEESLAPASMRGQINLLDCERAFPFNAYKELDSLSQASGE